MKKFGVASVCSGIEAVSEAWRDLPMRTRLLSEIEAFPIAVLEQRHKAACCRKRRPARSTPLWGDFSAIRMRFLLRLGINPADLDILIGGTPCQAFSKAGLRKGLEDPRGNLSLSFVRLADAIDNFRRHRGLAPIVIAWENVEGVLSMPDNAFGCFLAGLVGSDTPIVRPGGGRWTDAGVVAGPARTAAWRLTDAQHFGLAQRRERVLVVASARRECPPEILFESEGVRRDSPPRRKAGKNVTGTLGSRASAGGGLGTDFELDGGLVEATQAFGGNNTAGAIDIAACLNAHGGSGSMDFETETFVAHTLRAEGFDASEDGTGRGTPIVPVMASGCHGSNGAGIGREGDPAFALDTTGSQAIAFDCKASGQGGFGVEEIAPTMRAMNHRDSHQNAGGQLAVAFRITGNDGAYDTGDAIGALGTQTDPSGHAIVQGVSLRRLTARECERLQGFSDDYTLVTVRGKPAADGPRYRALGNSMPVPVIRWLGQRIVKSLSKRHK